MTEPDVPAQIGPYRIARRLCAGGMGVLYEGVQESLGRRVAIKLPRSEEAQAAPRLLCEGRLASRAAHPGVVDVYEIGALPSGTPYLVMEFLDGVPLCRALRDGLTGAAAVDVFRQIATALDAAHGRALVHRDLKPGNVMLLFDPACRFALRAKVFDFGVARLAASPPVTGPGLTRAGTVLGTPSYMAPEQWLHAAAVDGRADVYALGVMLYQLVVGRLPFCGHKTVDLMQQHVLRAPPPLPEPGQTPWPAPLLALIGQLLQKDPTARPTMAQVVVSLTRIGAAMEAGEGATQADAPAPTAVAPTAPAPTAVAPVPPRGATRATRPGWRRPLVSIALLSLLSAAAPLSCHVPGARPAAPGAAAARPAAPRPPMTTPPVPPRPYAEPLSPG